MFAAAKKTRDHRNANAGVTARRRAVGYAPTTMDEWPVYSVFGLRLATDAPLANAMHGAGGSADIRFTVTTRPPPLARALAHQPPHHAFGSLPDGQPFMTITRGEEADRVRYTDVASFYLGPDTITCHVLDRAYGYAVEIYLLGFVLAYWLARYRGVQALHAAAVTLDGRGVGFMATNKGGKTSLAAELVRVGHPLLTDDVLPVERVGTGYVGRPGYPQMRMWPDQAAHFHPSPERLDRVHPDLTKVRIPASDVGRGKFTSRPQPLARLYVPERRDPVHGEHIAIEPVPLVERIRILRQNLFLGRALGALGTDASWFAFCADLATAVPIRRLSYPSGVEHLARVAEAVMADFAEPGWSDTAPAPGVRADA